MEFNDYKPIYLQIADTLCEQVLSGQWKEDERIPSVRDYAVSIGVNPNTVMRAYDYLQDKNIIYNKRGIGYFVCPDAKQVVMNRQRDDFFKNDLAEMFRKMDFLGISFDEIATFYEKFRQ